MSVGKLSVVDFPEDKAQQLIGMEGIALFPLDADDHKFLQEMKDLMNLQPIGIDRREEVEISPMRISQFHHDKRIELDIKFEALGVLVEEINPPAQGESLLVPLFSYYHRLVDVVLL